METAIKAVPLLTDIESDKDLFKVLHNDDDVLDGAEFQIPCMVCVVLIGQEASHGIEVEHTYTSYAHVFPPPRAITQQCTMQIQH